MSNSLKMPKEWGVRSEKYANRSDRYCEVDDYGLQRQKAIRYGEDTNHRGSLVRWMKWVVSVWLISVLMITAFSSRLDLPSSVVITLLATTTANVLGLAHIILKGLFGGCFPRKFKDK